MSGLQIAFEAIDPDPDLPDLRKDLRLNKGSLLLVDFNHSTNPLTAVPASGSRTVPNIAWEEAAALHGSGTQSEWALDAVVNVPLAADGFIRRTPKGGIEVCMSQSTQTGTGKGFEVRKQASAADPFLQYILAHLEHDYACFMWEYITRPGLSNNPEIAEAAIYRSDATSPYTECLLNMNRVANNNATLGSFSSPALPQGVGLSRRSAAFRGWTPGGRPTSAAQIVAGFLAAGQRPGLSSAAAVNKGQSAVKYAMHFCDLTAAEMTYAEVDEIDAVMHAITFGPGGRYADDIFSALIP